MSLFDAIFGAKPAFGAPPFAGAHPQTGGAQMPTTPETLPVKHGFSGFIDRALNPTNALGQFGQALVASGGGPLGDAMAYMMKARQLREAQQQKGPHFEHVGDSFGVVDDTTGQFTPTYTAPHTQQPHYWESNDGSLHMIGDDGKPTEVFHDPTPKMNFIPDGMGGGQWVAVPNAGPAAPQMPSDPAPANAPPAGGVLDGITAQGESGGRDFNASGSLLRSPAGAMGRMQVMPGTLARPGFGVQPGNPGDPNDIARVGRDYRAAMQTRYGGDLAKMWGAYNWGPGNVDRAIATYGPDWLTHAPAETQAYVSSNLAAAPSASNSSPGVGYGAPMRIASKDQYDALPSGTPFIAPDGTKRVKP